MPATGTPLPWDRGNGPCVMAPPHLRGWAEEAAAFLSLRGMDGITAFATSGSSGSPPKAILFTRRALDICARGALEHLHAESGDWCCPLPVWHVGGAMIYLRAALAGTAVHTLRGKWCPQAYADLMKSSGARWSSLVPTQVVDLVSLGLRAPSTAGCIIVGGGALDTETGRKARTLGWPVVQSYGMTEAGSQLATALPGDSFHTDRLSLLPHWEAQTDKGGLLRFQGKGKLFGPPVDAGSWRVPSGKSRSAGVVEHPRPGAPGRAFADLSAPGGQTCQSPGGTGGSGCRSGRFAPQRPGGCRGGSPHPRAGMELVACGPSAAPLKQACREWNASAPGPQRIRAVMETPIPLTVMGKLDRNRLRSQLSDHPEKLKGIY